MRVVRTSGAGRATVTVLDDAGQPVEPVCAFLEYLGAKEYSPNTQLAYGQDATHLLRFLGSKNLALADMTPKVAVDFLVYLRALRVRKRRQPHTSEPTGELDPATVNRILASTSSLYDYLAMTERYDRDNPLYKVADSAQAHVPDRHHPFMVAASRQRPIRRILRVTVPIRLPRPLDDDTIQVVTRHLRSRRDRAIVLVMLEGGLRPGEAINLRVKDVEYNRRRVVVRFCDDHPKGARTKSRTERVVDLYEGPALQAIREYVLYERPSDTGSPFLFLVGRRGRRRAEPLGYHAVQRMFRRACTKAGIEEASVTPHALRHTHATRLWDGGMRELALQKRLGHRSPESTMLYTRVTDAAVREEYARAIGATGKEEG